MRGERGASVLEALVAAVLLVAVAGVFLTALDSASRAERDMAARAAAHADAERVLEHVAGALRVASLATVAIPGPGERAAALRFRAVRAIAPDPATGEPVAILAPAETAFRRAEDGTLFREEDGREFPVARGVVRFEVARRGASRAFGIEVEVEGRSSKKTWRAMASAEVLVEND